MPDPTLLADVKQRLRTVFQDVFDDDELEIDEKTTAEDVDEWDSLMHCTLVVNAEKEFDVRLNTAQVAEIQDVGGLIEAIAELIEAKSRA